MRTITKILGGASLALTLAACGGGSSGDGSDDIASLGGDATTTTDGGGGGGGGMELSDEQQARFEEAMLDYAACMREQGIDFPDPVFGEGGRVTQSVGGGPGDGPDPAEMDAADEICSPIMEEVQAQMPQPSPEEQEEARQRALEFAECMREHGIEDFPDPHFGDDGEVMIAAGASEGGPMSEQDREEMEAAQEACGGGGGPIIAGGATTSEDG